MTEALEGMSNWKVVGPDGVPAELLKIDHPAFAQCFHIILVNVWVTGEAPSNGNMRSSRSSTKRTKLITTTTEGSLLLPTQAKFY